MHTATHTQATSSSNPAFSSPIESVQTTVYANYQIIRRNGAVVPFEPNKIAVSRDPRSAALAPGRWHLPY